MMKLKLSRWMPMILTMALIFFLSMEQDPYRLLPIKMNNVLENWLEFFGHFLEYTLLGFTAVRSIQWQRSSSMKISFFTFALCLLYALSDEVHQYFVPHRTFQIHDLLVDSAGILLGLWLYQIYRNNKRSRKK